MENKKINEQGKKRYWLRGGVVGLVFILFVTILSFLQESHSVPIPKTIDFRYLAWGFMKFCQGGEECMIWIILSPLFMGLIYISIGIGIGYIYGKIKERRVD